MGMKIIDCNVFLIKIKACKTTRGHNFVLVKEQNGLDVQKYSLSHIEDLKLME